METHDPRLSQFNDMSLPAARRQPPVDIPNQEERASIARLSSALQSALAHDEARYRLVGPHGESLELPQEVLVILARAAAILARGQSISILAVHKELTTQQAADLLNLSRQYLVRMLDDGKIPHTRTGKHRRLRIEDVLAFQEARDRQRRESLGERFDEGLDDGEA